MQKQSEHDHVDLAALLDYLDGAGSESQRAHIRNCAQCLNQTLELSETRTRLRHLPPMQPPPELWSRIENELDEKPTGVPDKLDAWARPRGWMAVAASLLLVFTLVIFQQQPSTAPALAQAPAAASDERYQDLLMQSQQLENTLAYLNRQPQVITLGVAGQLDEISNSIAAIDFALMNSNSEQALDAQTREALMRERIQLLKQMVEYKAQPFLNPVQSF